MLINTYWRHKLAVSLVILLCLLAAAVVMLPVAVQVGAQSWLRDQGLDADIEFVGFNLASGTLVVENASGRDAAGKGFSLKSLLVEINWLPLFDKRLDVQRIEITGLYLDAQSQQQGGLVIAGIKLPAGAKQEDTPVQEKSEPIAWSAQLQQLSFSNIKACHSNTLAAGDKTASKQAAGIEQMMNACISLADLKWRGNIGWQAPANDQPIEAGVTINGNLQLDKLLLSRQDDRQTFLDLGTFAINDLAIKGATLISTESVELSKVKLLQHAVVDKQPVPYLASWENLTIGSPQINLEQMQASITEVVLSDLDVNIVRNKNGIAGIPGLAQEKATTKADKPQADKTPFNFLIASIIINGNSQALVTDKSVDPVFKESFTGINLKLAQVDSGKPEAKSPVSLALKVGEYGQVNLTGTMQPFAERLTLDLNKEIKNVDLANFNVYGKTFIGHRIRRGHLNLELKLVVASGKLDTEATLILQKFEIDSLEGKEAEKYKSDLGIPLSAALSLLRDKDDRIKLTVPVTGDINSPDFSFNDILATVTSKAIKEAIINYYTPFGLVKLLGGVIDLAAGLSFEPVVFVANKSALDEQDLSQLTKMSQLLSERPHVHLTMCGAPVRSDVLTRYKLAELGLKKGEEKKPFKLTDKQTGELLALFKARMDNIKKHMVNQLKVNPGQLILCSEPENRQWVLGIDEKPEIAISL